MVTADNPRSGSHSWFTVGCRSYTIYDNILYIIHDVNVSANLDKFGTGDAKNVFVESASFVKSGFRDSHILPKDKLNSIHTSHIYFPYLHVMF